MIEREAGKFGLTFLIVFTGILVGFALVALRHGYIFFTIFLVATAAALAIYRIPSFGKMAFQRLTLLVPVPAHTTVNEAALILEHDDAEIYLALAKYAKRVEANGILLKYRGLRIYDPVSQTFEINKETLHPKQIKILKVTN